MRTSITAFVASGIIALGAGQPAPAASPPPTALPMPPQPPAVPAGQAAKPAATAERGRFKLYETQNIFTLLLLDTRTGKIWQLQYTVDEKAVRSTTALSVVALAQGPDGRFELNPTKNMWNFILLDRIDGRTWQCQFSFEEKNRGCMPIDGPMTLE